MCGIIGYVGDEPCRELLLDGLARLEYRGYDSAGISLQHDGWVERVRAVGNLAALRAALPVAAADGRVRDAGVLAAGVQERGQSPFFHGAAATVGIGHTRWATHGAVTEANAHPHADTLERVHVVLNGIVENHAALRRRLVAEGATFTSETDAEVVAHLVAHHYAGDLAAATRAALAELDGHHAFVVLSVDEPGVLVGARRECPLVVGGGRGGRFIASSANAFLAHSRNVQAVEEGDVVVLSSEAVTFHDAQGARAARPVTRVTWREDDADRGAYETFMLKEIHEQPAAVARTVFDRVRDGVVRLQLEGLDDDALRAVRRIRVVACGTSYHAALVARCALEEWAQVPTEVDVASEYRYRPSLPVDGELVIGISQSGETADTLAAMRIARERGSRVLAVTNVRGSQATREADAVLLTRAGTEVGVAATKTFVSQVTALFLLALSLADLRRALPVARLTGLAEELVTLPGAIETVLARTGEQVQALAERWHREGFFLFLGRDVGLPVALEGSLKLKEITYIPSDAYAAGEMKHGPIALVAPGTPVVCVATDSRVLDKVLSNVAEVRARGAHVIAVATEGVTHVADQVDDVIEVPRTNWLLAACLAVVPLQLLAYHVARLRGLNVDQPRNLAKTVTVE